MLSRERFASDYLHRQVLIPLSPGMSQSPSLAAGLKGASYPLVLLGLDEQRNRPPERCCRSGARRHGGRQVEAAYRRGKSLEKLRAIKADWASYRDGRKR